MPTNDRFTSTEGLRSILFVLTLGSIPIQLLIGAKWLGLWLCVESGHLNQDLWSREVVARLTMMGWGWVVFAITCLVQLILMAAWTYAMNYNLPALQYRSRMTPLLAALIVFLPIINVILTPYALLEIWWGSDPARLPHAQDRKSPPYSIFVWSLMFLVTCLLGGVTAGVFKVAKNMISFATGVAILNLQHRQAFSGQAFWGLALVVCAVLTSLAMLVMIRELSQLQERRYDILHPSQPHLNMVTACKADEDVPA